MIEKLENSRHLPARLIAVIAAATLLTEVLPLNNFANSVAPKNVPTTEVTPPSAG